MTAAEITSRPEIAFGNPTICCSSSQKPRITFKNSPNKSFRNLLMRPERVSLSSTHQFNTKGLLLFSPQNPSVQNRKTISSTHPSVQHIPQFNTSLSSTHVLVQHTLQFNIKNPSVHHTPQLKKRQFNTPFRSTHPSVQHTPQLKEVPENRVLN